MPQLARGGRLEVGARALDVAAGEPQPAALTAQVQVGVSSPVLACSSARWPLGAAQAPQAERERRRPAVVERVARARG